MLHTAGLKVRENIRSDVDSDAMALMRQAGAIPFALTNVSECCMWYVIKRNLKILHQLPDTIVSSCN